jgi:AFG3 family protein
MVSSLDVVNHTRVNVHLNAPIQPEGGVSNNGTNTLPGPSRGSAPYHFTIGSLESFESLLISTQDELGIPPAERIPVSYHEEVSWGSTLLHFAPTLLIGGLLLWSMRRSGVGGMGGGGGGSGGIFGVGKSKAKMFNKDEAVNTRFKDVAGMDEAKEVSFSVIDQVHRADCVIGNHGVCQVPKRA